MFLSDSIFENKSQIVRWKFVEMLQRSRDNEKQHSTIGEAEKFYKGSANSSRNCFSSTKQNLVVPADCVVLASASTSDKRHGPEIVLLYA